MKGYFFQYRSVLISKDFNSDEEEDTYDPQNAKKRGAGPKISVKKTKW